MKQEILDSGDWTLLVCQGATNQDFLQGHLTCDIDCLKEGNALLGAACDLKGRVVASMFIANDPAAVIPTSLLLLPADSVPRLRELWDKYLLLYRGVTLTPYSGDFRLAVRLAVNLAASLEDNSHYHNQQLLNLDVTLQWADVSEQKTPPATVTTGMLGNEQSWNAYLIERGITYVTRLTSGMMTPQMLGYDKLGDKLKVKSSDKSNTSLDVVSFNLDVVSFTKGCYLGQEVVARVHYKGKSARSCYKVSFAAMDLTNITDESNDNPTLVYSRIKDQANEVGYLVNYYVQEGRCYGIALLSNNKVDQSNLYVNGQQLQLA